MNVVLVWGKCKLVSVMANWIKFIFMMNKNGI